MQADERHTRLNELSTANQVESKDFRMTNLTQNVALTSARCYGAS